MPYDEWWIKNIYYNYINVTGVKNNDWKKTLKNYNLNIRNPII